MNVQKEILEILAEQFDEAFDSVMTDNDVYISNEQRIMVRDKIVQFATKRLVDLESTIVATCNKE